MSISIAELRIEPKDRVSSLEVSRRERGSGLKRQEVLRSDIKRGRKTLTYTTICRESLPEENIWPKERERGEGE